MPPPAQGGWRLLRSLASWVLLVGAVVCLSWLSRRLESLPDVALPLWDGRLPPLVVLDAGHGGHDGGAVAGGVIEKHLALDFTLQLRARLLADGIRVRLTRDSDVFLPLEERAAKADELGADALVSLHLNTSPSPEVSGVETYFSERKPLSAQRQLQARLDLTAAELAPDPRGRRLAESLQRQVCAATQAADRGARDRNYVVVSQSLCPAALVECGFLTHADEAARLQTLAYQQKLIDGLARGVREFLQARRDSASTPPGLQAAR